MPTYEYVCTECGKQLEVIQSFTDDALTECPTCTGRLRKVFGNVGVSFKGSGFYKTDSRSSASKAASSSSETKTSESKPAETKPAETKSSETKPAETKSSDKSSSTPKAS